MSILSQIYGEAKGIETSLGKMSKSLSKMEEEDRRSNRQEDKYRQFIITQRKRESQDRKRYHKEYTETIENTVGKKAGANIVKGGLLTALAVGLGAAVAKSLFDKNVLGNFLGGDGESDSSGSSSGGGTSGTEETGGTGTESSTTSSSSGQSSGPVTADTAGKIQTGIDVGRVSSPFLKRLIPGVGMAFGAAEAASSAAAGDHFGAGLAGLSMVPGPIGWTGLAGKALWDWSKSDEQRQKEQEKLAEALNKVMAKQSGGFTGMVPNLGQPATGDHFLTSVAPGSYIMNRNLVSAIGHQSGGIPVALERGEIALPPGSFDQSMMDFLNYDAFPRFQTGGIVEHLHGDPSRSGYDASHGSEANAHDHYAFSSRDLMIKVKDQLIAKGYNITEFSGEGGHAPGGWHYRDGGTAFDVPWSQFGSGPITESDYKKSRALQSHVHEILSNMGHSPSVTVQASVPADTGGGASNSGRGSSTSSGDSLFGGFGELGSMLSGLLGEMNSVFSSIGGLFDAGGGSGLGGMFGGMGSSGSGEISSLGSGKGTLKGLGEQDWKDLAYIVSAEAARGTDDEYGVAAAILNRVAHPDYPNTIKGVGVQPGQFEAVFKGLAYEDPQLAKKLQQNQDKIAAALEKLQGRTDFKGTTQYGNMGSSDIRFSENGNFYHYASQVGRNDPVPQNPSQQWKQWVAAQRGGSITKHMQSGGNVIADNLKHLNETFKMYELDTSNPIIIMQDDTGPEISMSGGATNNTPQYLPTRSDCWASAMLEYRERSFNVVS